MAAGGRTYTRKPRPRVVKEPGTRDGFHALYAEPSVRSVSTGDVVAHFGELKRPCEEFIAKSRIIIGCVAWITDPGILAALSGRFVALVVQKENWWKKSDSRGIKLARGYARLTGGLPANAFPDPLASYGDTALAPIACMGGTGGGNGYGNPLMHHKFLVRCDASEGQFVPQAVWTGSFNFSVNANGSFENAVEIYDPEVAQGYLEEFAVVASLSESLNWKDGVPTPGKTLGRAFVPPKASTRTRKATLTATAAARRNRR